MTDQTARYGKGKSKRYLVDTKRDVDEPHSIFVEYVTGWSTACDLALKNAYSLQTTVFVKDLRTGKTIGGYRFASNTGEIVAQGRCKVPSKPDPKDVGWGILNTPQDFFNFADNVMVPVVAKNNPGIAKGFHNEILNLSAKGNKKNAVVDLFSYIEEYLCSFLETHGDTAALDQIRDADQYMRSMVC
jgi:hypothetical protein